MVWVAERKFILFYFIFYENLGEFPKENNSIFCSINLKHKILECGKSFNAENPVVHYTNI